MRNEVTETDKAWRDKAHRIINALSRAEYVKANRLDNGQMRKRHVPYSIPQEAHDLIRCLNTNDELSAKALFHSSYAISKLNY